MKASSPKGLWGLGWSQEGNEVGQGVRSIKSWSEQGLSQNTQPKMQPHLHFHKYWLAEQTSTKQTTLEYVDIIVSSCALLRISK